MDSKLKKGALGYKSKEVEAYLVELSNKYQYDINAKDGEIRKLNEKVAELEKKIDSYEAERLSVADALVKAQKEAQDIMDAAVTEAEAKRNEIQADCEKLEKKMADSKKELANLQKDALKVVADYKDVIAAFTDFSEVAHDD